MHNSQLTRAVSAQQVGQSLNQGQASNSIVNAPPVAPALEVGLSRFQHQVEQLSQIINRQGNFLDRVRGTQPQDASKGIDRGEPISAVARFDSLLSQLEICVDVLHNQAADMDRLV